MNRQTTGTHFSQEQSTRRSLLAIARISLLASALFVGVMGFAILLSSRTLSDFSRETHLSAYQGLGEQLQFSIERGLRFGRPLDGYASLQEQLDAAVGLADGGVDLVVVDAEGRVLHRAGLAREDASPEEPRRLAAGGEPANRWVEADGRYVLVMPLRGREQARQGSLLLAVDGESIRRDYRRFIWRSISLLLVVAAIVAAVQSGWVARILRASDGARRRRSLYLALLVFVGGGQIAFSLPALFFFRDALAASEMAKIAMTGRMLAQDLERLLHKGLSLDQIYGMAAHFDEVRRNNPEIAAMRLLAGDVVIAASGKPADGGGAVELPVNSYWPDDFTPRRVVARLEVRTDPAQAKVALRRIYLNQLTILIVSLLLLMELTRMLVTVRPAAATAEAEAEAEAETAERQVSIVRMLAFLFFFGYDMVLSFVPLTARTLPGSIGGLGPTQLAALPNVIEAVAGGAGILVAARVFRRLNMRRSLYLGILLAMLGAVSANLARSIVPFVLARGLSGLGFGLVFMCCQLGLMAKQTLAGGLAQMYSGVLAGSLCGVATGAMASELAGFRNVFAISFALLAVALVLVRMAPSPDAAGETRAPVDQDRAGALRFFLSAEFLAPVALATLPVAMTLAGFVNFGMPMELNNRGVAQGDIGRLFMVYGLCFIILGPLFAKMADRTGRYLFWVTLACLANAGALVAAWLWPSYGGYALAAFLAGVANCLLASSALVLVLRGVWAGLQKRETVGSVYRMVERCGHMAGPLAFSLILSGNGLLAAGLAFGLAAVFLFLTCRSSEGRV